MNIIWKGSPNFSKRTQPIRKIVIHWFGIGTLESANARFQNKANQTSAHYGISKGRVWQWVKEQDVAWHAGNWAVNSESIGIEHDAVLNKHDLTEQDYQLSGELVAGICQRYGIPLDRKHIIGHREAKATQCPGTVNIDKIIAIAETHLYKKLSLIKKIGEPTLYVLDSNEAMLFGVTPEAGAKLGSYEVIELSAAEFSKYRVSKALLQ